MMKGVFPAPPMWEWYWDGEGWRLMTPWWFQLLVIVFCVVVLPGVILFPLWVSEKLKRR